MDPTELLEQAQVAKARFREGIKEAEAGKREAELQEAMLRDIETDTEDRVKLIVDNIQGLAEATNNQRQVVGETIQTIISRHRGEGATESPLIPYPTKDQHPRSVFFVQYFSTLADDEADANAQCGARYFQAITGEDQTTYRGLTGFVDKTKLPEEVYEVDGRLVQLLGEETINRDRPKPITVNGLSTYDLQCAILAGQDINISDERPSYLINAYGPRQRRDIAGLVAGLEAVGRTVDLGDERLSELPFLLTTIDCYPAGIANRDIRPLSPSHIDKELIKFPHLFVHPDLNRFYSARADNSGLCINSAYAGYVSDFETRIKTIANLTSLRADTDIVIGG